jgi:hypothetical protein
VALGLLAATVVPADAAKLPPQTALPMQTRGAGDYSFSPVTVSTNVIGLEARMDLTEATGPLPLMTAALEGSLDGGNSWRPVGSFTRPAGPKVLDKKTGTTQTREMATFGGGPFWRDATNPNRRLRGKATIGGTVRFALVVTSITR